jgi:RIO-like serine/threonine protein kinase
MLVQLAIECIPRSALSSKRSAPGIFGIAHADLDLQNILVDEEGKVIGIVD